MIQFFQTFIMTSTFTCITCRVAFHDAEMQRSHYKTDWHRYNLKRKVADLPPVTVEEFNRRVVSQREKDETSGQEITVYCNVCRKSYTNQKAFDNHLSSKKHKLNLKEVSSDGSFADGSGIQTTRVKKTSVPSVASSSAAKDNEMEIDPEIEEVDSDEWEDEDDWEDENNPIFHNNCLFCSNHSANMLKNLKHMSIAHGFFLPDAEFLTDPRGLLMYLGEKVCQGFMCLWCNDRGRTFYSAEAAKAHMIDKGHTKMLFEGDALAEYSDFYDYSKSYPDADGDADPDEEVEIPELDSGDYFLKLPSGATIGHRSLFIYYKQSLNPNRQVAFAPKKMNTFLSTYRALGWSGTDSVAAAKKARDVHYMKRIQAKHACKLGIKANKLQTHFRHQVLF
ncbi:hypothetical protein FOCC_FOCC004991 [Frankliniella occidentalis]|nr:hypothetical protein FOCC_FOCC004991 [Frankliniella occidentalis]